ncbi:hypothetical protein T484DRAFT_3645736 [Baffinella frigidus]|nr:hypothetical protein T484DRAFT_3645736 [Cryptophyta sp. CCMP2293]
MSDEARFDMLDQRVSEMRELCSKRPDLHSEKQLVDRFDEVMRNIRSPKCRAYRHTPDARHTTQDDYTHLCAYPLLSDPESNLASGWLFKEEPRQKPLRHAVIAPRFPSCAGKRNTSKDDVLSAGSNAPAVRPSRSWILLRPTRFGDESCAAPARAPRRITWDSTEYLWEFPVAEASRKCFEHPVVASPIKLPIRVKRPLWECEVAEEVW